MPTLVILGGGTAGTMTANKLREPAAGVGVARSRSSTPTTTTTTSPATCSCRSASYRPDQVTPVAPQVRRRQARAARLRRDRPVARRPSGGPRRRPTPRLRLPRHRHRHHPRPDQTPGMLGGEWRRSVHEFYTYDGLGRPADKLKRVPGWPAGHPHHRDADQVPGRAPGVRLPRRRLPQGEGPARQATEIIYVTPLDGGLHQAGRQSRARPPPVQAKGHHGRARLHDRERRPERPQRIVSYDEREIAYDLLVTVPLNMGADFVGRSGLGDELNYVPVDKHTHAGHGIRRRSSPSATRATCRPPRPARSPTSRSRSSSRTSSSCIAGQPMTHKFDGHANCFIETGQRQGAAHRLQLRHRAAHRELPLRRSAR
jgi:sulfide:quinone oxidoreductase